MFDLVAILTICLLSLLSFIKGFMKSLFSLLNWTLASLLSYFLTPVISKFFLSDYSYFIAHSIVGTILFTIFLVVLSIVTSIISKTFLTVIPRSVDKSLGFAFGFAKGYFVIALIFGVITTIYSYDLPLFSNKVKASDGKLGPKWLVEAKSYNVISLGSNMLQPIINKVAKLVSNPKSQKETLDNLIDNSLDSIEDNNFDKVKKIQDLYKNIDKNVDIEIDIKQKGYHEKEIEKKNQLIEAIQ